MPHFDDDSELDAREYPEPDADVNGDDETVTCHYCRASIYEDAEQCPRCGNYISAEDSVRQLPRWVVVGALLCLAAALSWVFWG